MEESDIVETLGARSFDIKYTKKYQVKEWGMVRRE